MLAIDRDALICDLAETYGVLDYRALPVPLLATLASGLGADSRIRMRLDGTPVPSSVLLLAGCMDRLSLLAWMQSEDGAKSKNRPTSLVDILLGRGQTRDVTAYADQTAWERTKAEILTSGEVEHGQ